MNSIYLKYIYLKRYPKTSHQGLQVREFLFLAIGSVEVAEHFSAPVPRIISPTDFFLCWTE